MRWRPISAGVLSDKGFAPKDTQRRCGPMELPQSTAKVGPDPPWWGVGVHWTGAVLLWGASTAYDLFARKDRRGRGTKLRPGPGQLGGIGMPPPRRRLIFYRYFFKEKSCMNLRHTFAVRAARPHAEFDAHDQRTALMPKHAAVVSQPKMSAPQTAPPT